MGREGDREDGEADAAEEAADGGGLARRIRPRKSDSPRDRAAVESGRSGGADGPLVRHDRSRTQLPRQHEYDRPRRPPARVQLARSAERVARIPNLKRTPAAA